MADNFLNYPNWFDKEFEIPLRKRYSTFRTALTLLSQMPNHEIVETGCTRFKDDWGAGNSTYIFGKFVVKEGGFLTTIDISQENIEACKEVTKEFAPYIGYINMDSHIALRSLVLPIDLLYLDSLDAPETGDATEAQKHNLQEFKIAEPMLHEGSIILIDDNDMENGGKSKLTKEYLVQKGYKLILDYVQTLWMKR
jgi:hypothetical protein